MNDFNSTFSLMAAYRQAQSDERTIEAALAADPTNVNLTHDYAISSASVDDLYSKLRSAGVFK